VKKRPLLWFFLITFAITWGLAVLFFAVPDFVTRLTGKISVSNPLFILAVWAPNLAALIVSAAVGGGAGVLSLLQRLIRFRVGLLWYLLALLLLPAAGLLFRLATGQPIILTPSTWSGLVAMLGILVITGTLGEELGWRGFALPRLLRRFSPIVASLLLGAVWGIWHLPSFFVSGLPQAGLQIPVFLLGALSLSVFATWILLHARGSVFLSVLLHFSINFTLNVLAVPLLPIAVFLAALALVLLIVYGPRLSRAAKVEI
jgi:hypothetical protein